MGCKHMDFDPYHKWHYYVDESYYEGECLKHDCGTSSHSRCDDFERKI